MNLVAAVPITGAVKDELGNPLSGVTVQVLGKNVGTITDDNGHFSLEASSSDSLQFTYIGYQTKHIIVGTETRIDVTLEANAGSLNQVEIVAFGEQKKATVTGAIASIGTAELKQSPSANLKVSLAGRLPGLTVIQNGGEPGVDQTQLYLRGRGTLNGQAPLVLVDGIERDISYLDPNEVKNVTILKDASATALFGVKGANGVVLVTTRRGEAGKPEISLTQEFGIQSFTKTPDDVDAYTWAQLKNEAWRNDNPGAAPNDPTNQPPYSADALQHFKSQDNPQAYPDHNWLQELTHKYVPMERVNLNMSGGGGFARYFVNVGYLYQGGLWKTDPDLDYDARAFLRRYSFRANIDATLDKKKTLTTFLNVAGYLDDQNKPGKDNYGNGGTYALLNTLFQKWPSVQPGPTTPDGEVLIGDGNYGQSPWAMINRTGYQKNTGDNVTATWGLEKDFSSLTKGLTARFVGSFDTRTVYSLSARRDYERWVQFIDPNTPAANGGDSVMYLQTMTNFINTPLSTSTSATFQSHTQLQFFLNYARDFGKHAVTGMLMANQESWIRNGERLPFHLRGLATRLTYGYDERYNIEFDAGYNGSEQFRKGNRYGLFPAISAGWVASNESFLKGNKAISFLKLRGSYGIVGNDQLGDQRFLYLDDISVGTGGFTSNLGEGHVVNEDYLGNPDLKWEIAKKGNIGLELGLFDQLNLTVDLFTERRNNVLINRGTIPTLIGQPSSSLPPINLGRIENHGYEINLKYEKIISHDFTVLANLNYNYARNKILFVDEAPKPDDYAYRYRMTGYEIGQIWGYITNDGYYQSQEQIDNSGLDFEIGKTPRPGDLIIKDLNGDKVIDEKDIAPIRHSTVPRHTWGAALSVNYKGFDLSALFQGHFDVGSGTNSFAWEWYDFRDYHKNAWTAERAANGEKVTFPALSQTQSFSEFGNTFFAENTSYVRLKSLEIGYTLPERLSRKLGTSHIRIYLNGLNLFTWDKMKFNSYDPELASQDTYPIQRIFNSGININF
ncbi:TonB-dependent receptor [Compostibacter hankyongensis]